MSAFPAVAAAEQASQPGFAAAGGLDAGLYHTCALVDGGGVRCWGASPDGQLGYANTNTIGDDETPDTAGPVSLGAGRVTAIAAGDAHTCALMEGGSVRCWGLGLDGRLGYGNTNTIGDDETPDTAGAVSLGGRATAITAGGGHTCALLVGGSVRCWGSGGTGELGYGNTDNVGGGSDTTPDKVGPVNLGRPATAISAGRLHTCALLDDGSVRCWGYNGYGELGYDNTIAIGDNETPIGAYSVYAVACPSTSQCTAVDDVGRQVTFNPTEPGTPIPTTIDNRRTLRAVACPSVSQCTAVDAVGHEVTFNPTAPGTPTRTTISSYDVSGVACPSVSQCTAVDTVGREVTFNPTAPGTPTPSAINNDQTYLSGVACPSVSQCTAVDASGREVTFNPTAPGIPTPTTIDGHFPTAVACPSVSQCTAVDQFGAEVTFNPIDPTAPGTPAPTTVDSGDFLDGVACPSVSQCTAVGGNAGGVVTFNPTAPGAPTPTIIDSGQTISGVACPSAAQCTAVDSIGRELTFNPSAPGAPAPIQVDAIVPVDLGGQRATAITAGDYHTCALLDDGSVRCWGAGADGRLGYGNTTNVGDTPGNTPEKAGPVNLGGRAVAISAGAAHTCARLEDGKLRCWGSNANGKLGYGNTTNVGDNETPNVVGPVDLGSGRTDLAVSAAKNHTCARLDDGSVRCWGYGGNGLLGYCNQNSIGDDEAPGFAGPVKLEPGDGGAGCPSAAAPTVSAVSDAAPVIPGLGSAPFGASIPVAEGLAAQRLRAAALRRCLRGVSHRAGAQRRRAQQLAPDLRVIAMRRIARRARHGRGLCLHRYARTPGRVTGLSARGLSRTTIALFFRAPGTDGANPPAARSYLVKQSRHPIRTLRAFRRAQTLCRGSCFFPSLTRVGAPTSLLVTDLLPQTTYYFAVAARDNVSCRLGPRSTPTKATTTSVDPPPHPAPPPQRAPVAPCTRA